MLFPASCRLYNIDSRDGGLSMIRNPDQSYVALVRLPDGRPHLVAACRSHLAAVAVDLEGSDALEQLLQGKVALHIPSAAVHEACRGVTYDRDGDKMARLSFPYLDQPTGPVGVGQVDLPKLGDTVRVTIGTRKGATLAFDAVVCDAGYLPGFVNDDCAPASEALELSIDVDRLLEVARAGGSSICKLLIPSLDGGSVPLGVVPLSEGYAPLPGRRLALMSIASADEAHIVSSRRAAMSIRRMEEAPRRRLIERLQRELLEDYPAPAPAEVSDAT